MIWIALCETHPVSFKAFAHYVSAKLRQHDEALSFRKYVSESIRMSVEGKYFKEPWSWEPRKPAPTVDVNTLIDDIITKAGLEVVNEST